MKKVLITGATGATGGNAIKKLLELKVPVRALVHKVDERSEKLSSQGVEIVRLIIRELGAEPRRFP
jgi:NAD(P)H dehydrogenase (quinone)